MEQLVSECRACKARIIWVKTAKGTNQPLDADPVLNGNIELVEGVAQVVPEAERAGRALYMPHHATCPQAGKFRRKKQP